MNLYYALLSIFVLLSATPAFADQKPFVLHFSKDQYQAGNRNWVARQDEKGVMYFGNEAGLVESDGTHWKLHQLPHAPAIRGVAVASHQTLFTGGYEEIGRWDRDLSGTLVYTSLKDLIKKGEFANEQILQVWISNNNVYFQSRKQVYVYDYHTIRLITPDTDIQFLLKIRDGYWFQKVNGPLFCLQGDQLEQIKGSEFFSQTTIRTILPHGAHDYLIGISTGEIYLYDGKEFVLWNRAVSDELAGQELNCGIYSIRHNTYFFGTRLNGVYKTASNGEILSHFSTENGLQDNKVNSLYEDQQHNIWITQDKGFSYLRYTPYLSYFLADESDKGTLLTATYWGDYLLLGTTRGVYYTLKSQLDTRAFSPPLQLIGNTEGRARSFMINQGELYCAHSTGVLQIAPDLSVTRPYRVNLPVYKITAAQIKDKELLLLSTRRTPIIIDKATGNTHEIRQLSDPIQDIETDYMGNIWLATNKKGVYKCRLNEEADNFDQLTYYGREKYPSLPERLRMAKIGNRIIFLGDNRFFIYSESSDKLISNPLLNNCFQQLEGISQVVHSHDEENWAIGTSSVHRFVYDGSQARILNSYDIKADKLSLVTRNKSISILNDSTAFICLETGFILFRNQLHRPSSPRLPVPYIESVVIDADSSEPLFPDPGRVSDIPYKYDAVSMRYSIGNAFAGNWQVECLLESEQLNGNWRVLENENEVTYERLPRGSYTFRIRTTDGMGSYSPEASFSFHVLPPWYRTPWAYLSYALIILLAIYLVQRISVLRYRQQVQRKIRQSETFHLQNMNRKLQDKIEEKKAELFTQTSCVMQKNELILRLRGIVNDWHEKNNHHSLRPLYLKINQLLAENMDEDEDWKMFLIKFEEKHHYFFRQLMREYPDLTHNDLRLCACLKLNLDTKEIASLMNLSVRGVENNRYRLRKKLKLTSNQNLNEFFLGYE